MAQQMSVAELNTFLANVFPQVADEFDILAQDGWTLDVALVVGEKHLRPGGTVSGPSMFGLVDVAMYLCVLAQIGPKALAVTTNCSIDFMRKPAARTNLIARCRLLKLGRSLAVGDCLVFSAGSDKPVARASLTYSIPPVGSESDKFEG